MSLHINNLHASIEKKEILKGIDLNIAPGEVHVIMGPNGSGKSTLAQVLMGNPAYHVERGEVMIDNKNLLAMPVNERATSGLFLSQQYAPEILGVSVTNLLRLVVESKTGEKQHPIKFYKKVVAVLEQLGLGKEFASRSLHAGASGGEKKRLELAQLLLIEPTYAILDEIDSGLDVDALKIVAEGITTYRREDRAILLITHYNRLLDYVIPDVVHIMYQGTIIKTGGKELAKEIEATGYESFIAKAS